MVQLANIFAYDQAQAYAYIDSVDGARQHGGPARLLEEEATRYRSIELQCTWPKADRTCCLQSGCLEVS